MVCREFLGECLEEVPCRFSSVDGTESSVVAVLTWVCSEQECSVLLRRLGSIIQHFHVASNQVVRDVLECVVAQAHLHGLIQEQHVDLIAPRVLAEVRGVGVGVNVARSVFDEETKHGRAAGAAIHPDRERSILWVLIVSQSVVVSSKWHCGKHTLRASN